MVLIVLWAAPAAGQVAANWAQYLFSPHHTSYNSSAAAITAVNAPHIRRAWTFVPPLAPAGLSGFYSSPTVYDGVVYVGARNGYFYALNETTGAEIWSRFIGYVTKTTCSTQGFTSTATVAADPTTGNPTVYVYGADGYLYAMNAATGADVWPPALVALPSSTVNDYYAWSSPLVVGGNIYVGISSQCDNPLVRGGLDEFSQASGAQEGTFWTTPAGTVGASIWSSPAAYGRSIYVSTGNGPSNSLGVSIIKLSRSLSEQGAWTVPAGDLGADSDFGASPTIWPATVNGTATHLVGACNKNGTFYALRTSNLAAGPVWSIVIGSFPGKGRGSCIAAADFDGSHLYLASNATTINGTPYKGSVRQVDPATGIVEWQTGLTGPILGTPGLDGGGVIAAASYGSTAQESSLFLIDASTGTILKTIPYGTSSTFGQPVFSGSYLFVASTDQGLTAYTAP